MLAPAHSTSLPTPTTTTQQLTSTTSNHQPTTNHHRSHPQRSNVERSFTIEEVYEGDISVVQIATCKANSQKVIIKSFHREKLAQRVDLQNKVCVSSCSMCSSLLVVFVAVCVITGGLGRRCGVLQEVALYMLPPAPAESRRPTTTQTHAVPPRAGLALS